MEITQGTKTWTEIKQQKHKEALNEVKGDLLRTRFKAIENRLEVPKKPNQDNAGPTLEITRRQRGDNEPRARSVEEKSNDSSDEAASLVGTKRGLQERQEGHVEDRQEVGRRIKKNEDEVVPVEQKAE